MRRRIAETAVFLFAAVLFLLQPVAAEAALTAGDSPNDGGSAILVEWSKEDAAGAESIRILRSESEDGEFEEVGTVPGFETSFKDKRSVLNKTPYYYKIAADFLDGSVLETAAASPAMASVQYFHSGRLNILLGSLLTAFLVMLFIYLAKTGMELYIRPIAGIEAVDEAIGRATEMGKPILYVSGLGSISDIATLAAISILGRVAKKAAEYDTPLLVPCRDPIVMAVQQEVVKEAYLSVNRPDAYREENIFYITDSQFGYVAAVDGIMIREKPATNFYMGMFFAESLLLAETGASTGAIQISGTDMVTQIPFFITSCDYTLIGEELYAAGAYLSAEPLLLGSLKGQDWTKFIIVIMMIVGILASLLGFSGVQDWFITQ